MDTTPSSLSNAPQLPIHAGSRDRFGLPYRPLRAPKDADDGSTPSLVSYSSNPGLFAASAYRAGGGEARGQLRNRCDGLVKCAGRHWPTCVSIR